MSDQVQPRNSSAMASHARRSMDLEPLSAERQNQPDEWIDRIEDQITQALENCLADRTMRTLTEEARKVERDRLIRRLRDRLIERRMYATWLESEVEARDQRLSELFETARVASEDLQRTKAELAEIQEFPARHALRRGRQRIGRAVRSIRRRVETPGALAQSVWTRLGVTRSPNNAEVVQDQSGRRTTVEGTARTEQERPELTRGRNDILRWIPPRRDPYELLLQNTAADAEERFDQLKQLVHRPTFSVFVTQEHADLRRFRETEASLRRQVYPDRDVVLLSDAESSVAMTDRQTTGLHDVQERLEILRMIAGRASSDYLVFVNHGAILHEDALLEFARTIDNAPEPPDLIFADEDRIDANGGRFDPRFRPSWSPELMLAYHAVGGTFAVRRSTFATVGGLRPEFGHAWAYDLVLRIAEHSDRVLRVAKVLSSVPADRGADDPVDRCSVEMIRQSALALTEAIGRRGIDARVAQPSWASRLRVPAFELDFPERGPKVAILIPTRDRVDLLRRCVESIRARTTYQDYEIVVIDNGSREAESLEYFAQLGPKARVIRIEDDERGFSYARIHNEAVQTLEDSVEFVALLNNDTEVVRSEWLSQLVGYGQLAGVGAVGGRLLYPDGRLQHAGIVTDLFEGGPGHLFKGLPWWHTDLQFLDRVARNVSAVTAACLLVRKETYLRIGGFDEDQFAVGFNDVDFCLRLSAVGLRCVYAPRAELLHFEGASRGFTLDLHEQQRFLERWGHRSDPYYHPALIRNHHRPGISTKYRGAPVPIRKRPIRVLVDFDRLDGRGSARFVKNLIEGYRRRGRIVPELCCRVDGAMGTMLRDAGFPVSVVPIDTSRVFSDRIQTLVDLFDRHEYDLIHVVGLEQFPTVHAARLARIPSLWSIREAVDFRDAFLRLDDDAARAAIGAFSEASRVVFPAQQVRNLFTPIETCWNFEVVHEAGPSLRGLSERLDARSRRGLSQATTVVTCLHDGEVEDVGIFLDQCSAILQSGADVVSQIIGPPEMGQWLARDELYANLRHRARFVSMIDGAGQEDALAASDVLVNVVRRDLRPEIFSIAQELRKPLIQCEVLGTDEYVGTNSEVLRFDPSDPGTLRFRLESVLKAPDRQAARGGITTRFGFEDMARRYEQLSLEAIRAHSKQSSVLAREARGVA